MSDFFKPADPKLGMLWFTDAITPGFLKLAHNINEVIIAPEDKKMLRSLRDDRLIYFSNHPTQAEPTISWLVGQAMGARFKGMAARRAFDFGFGLVGKVFQSTGAFSVVPGVADRESMSFARKVLAAPKGKLTLYPEGEPMSSENDSLMPFQPGILKIGFAGLGDAMKQDPAADITILSSFIKYVIDAKEEVIRKDLEHYVGILCNKLGVEPGKRNLLRSFLMLGRVMIEKAEKDYGLPAADNEDFDFRMGRIRHHLLDHVADKLGAPGYDREADAIHKLRHLTTITELIHLKYPMKGLPTPTAAELSWAEDELVRAYDFIVIKKDYLVSYPSAERFYEWLARWESLLLGKRPRMLGGEPSHLPRKAYVSFAKPFRLREYQDVYKKDKKGTLETVLGRLRTEMEALLEESMRLTHTLVEPYDVGET